jgi:hypothetical protein
MILLTLRSMILFGIGTQSSWSGNMLAGQIWVELSPEQKHTLVINPEYKSLLETRTPFSELTPEDIASTQTALDPGLPAAYTEPFKPNNRTNWNFAGFLPISKEWQSFALTAIGEYPDEYLEAVTTATVRYFTNQGCYNWVYENSQRVQIWHQVTSGVLLLGQPGTGCEGEGSDNFVITPWLFMIVSVTAALLLIRRGFVALQFTYWFSVLMIAYGLISTNLVIHAEFPRYRMEVDFLLVATGIAGLAIIFQALTKKRVTSG